MKNKKFKVHQPNTDNNFIYLFISLLSLLLGIALAQDYSSSWENEIFPFFTLLMLALSVKSLHTQVEFKKIIYVLIASIVLLFVVSKIFQSTFILYFNLLIILIFFITSFWAAYKQVLFSGEINENKIIGSITLFLLLGLIWTVLYLILLVIDPSAFTGIDANTWQSNFSQVAYFSFVTLSTLGYGDISPNTHLGEFLVYLEAIAGVFYMAIIVASLISVKFSNDKD